MCCNTCSSTHDLTTCLGCGAPLHRGDASARELLHDSWAHHGCVTTFGLSKMALVRKFQCKSELTPDLPLALIPVALSS